MLSYGAEFLSVIVYESYKGQLFWTVYQLVLMTRYGVVTSLVLAILCTQVACPAGAELLLSFTIIF